MKKLTTLIAATAMAGSLAGGAMAGQDTIKPLIKKSTQAPVSLGLGGLGAGASAAVVIGGIVLTVVVVQATSGT